jgi:hypothetical protein
MMLLKKLIELSKREDIAVLELAVRFGIFLDCNISQMNEIIVDRCGVEAEFFRRSPQIPLFKE